MVEFVGCPFGRQSAHAFYKAFKYRKKSKFKIVTIGEFFFLQISDRSPVCVAELQLLWEDTQTKDKLTSSKLYFLPESTPDGRLDIHGQDEMLEVSGKMVLKLDDLVSWMRCDVTWHKGTSVSGSVGEDPADRLLQMIMSSSSGNFNRLINVDDIKSEKQLAGDVDVDEDSSSVTIMSYPKYCRYKACLKRLEGEKDDSVKDSLISQLGHIPIQKGSNMHIMFCKDVFEYPELFDNEKCCHNIAPKLKGKPKKKKRKNKRSASPSSESNDSVESKASIISRVNGIKRQKIDWENKTQTEQEFYDKLFKFMKGRNSPIDRIPHLGFKQIDLFVFYCYAKKLGGYDKICEQRLWKHLYNELGGCQGSTSAATCTRRHYEKLLLPFEREMNNEEEGGPISDRPIESPTKDKCEDQIKNESDWEQEKIKTRSPSPEVHLEPAPAVEIIENIPPIKIKIEPINCDERKRKNSDSLSPILNKKIKEEQMVDKEKKWEEIRKKNALARVKNNGVGPSVPGRVNKKVTVATVMQQQRSESSSDASTGQRTSNTCPEKSSESSPRPSVIHHTPVATDTSQTPCDKDAEHHNKKAAYTCSPWRRFSSCRLPSPSLLPGPGSSLPSTAKQREQRPKSAHLNTSCTKQLKNTDVALNLSVKDANSQVCQPFYATIAEAFKKEYQFKRESSPSRELDLSVKKRISEPERVRESSIASPLMSLSTMSARLMEKNRSVMAHKPEPPKTVKVQPMVHTVVSPKTVKENCNEAKVPPRPAHSSDKSQSSSSTSSGYVKTQGGHMIEPVNRQYGYPQFSTFPYMFPPSHLMGNSKPLFMHSPSYSSANQYPSVYFPPPSMYGLPPMSAGQPAFSQEHYQASLASYKELMQRGGFPGPYPPAMYPGYPPMDPTPMFSPHSLRQDQFPSSSIHKP